MSHRDGIITQGEGERRMTTDERDAIIAEALDAAGHPELAWDDAPMCANGHPTHRYLENGVVDRLVLPNSDVCRACFFEGRSSWALFDSSGDGMPVQKAYPEWRIGRVPKPFHTSLDLIITALNALGMEWRYRRYFGMESFVEVGHGEILRSQSTVGAKPATIAKALVVCAVEVLSRRGEG